MPQFAKVIKQLQDDLDIIQKQLLPSEQVSQALRNSIRDCEVLLTRVGENIRKSEAEDEKAQFMRFADGVNIAISLLKRFSNQLSTIRVRMNSLKHKISEYFTITSSDFK